MLNSIKLLCNRYSVILENFSYVTFLQVFMLAAPLITYPYLVSVLGMELYGYIITGQILSGYASIIIDFGSNSVCAKHVSINRNDCSKLSEILCTVLAIRSLLWVICLVVYMLVVFFVPDYRRFWLLFLISYGWTLNDLFFPQYFFQGLEHMKESTLINIFVKLLFIGLVFIVVKEKSDYLYVPFFYMLGYGIAGIISLILIHNRLHVEFKMPNISQMKLYVVDSMPIFATDLICTIKDRLSYLLLGSVCGMSHVVVYDLGQKINSLLTIPSHMVSVVLFPRFAKNRNIKKFIHILILNTLVALFLVIVTNIFLENIVEMFVDAPVDMLCLRIFTLAPLFLSISSCIASNLFVAFGYNKYMLYSIIVTTVSYVSLLLFFSIRNNLTIYTFVITSVSAYFIELIYRLIKAQKVIVNENK